VALLASALGGCSETYFARRDSISVVTGDAVAVNRVTHVIDPWPAASGRRNIAFNGERVQAAAERYRNNRVITPVNITTSSSDYQKIQQSAASQQAATAQSTSVAPAAPVKGP
jgi:hypothetical protein